MLIRGRLYAPESRGDVLVELTEDRITSIGSVDRGMPAPEGAMGGPDSVIVPGLIDIQVNGAFGQDFSDPSSDIDRVRTGLAQFGVTAFLATVITSPPAMYGPCLDHIASAMDGSNAGSRLLGVHIEGPFIAPDKRGTHQLAWLQPPSVAVADGWLARGPVKLVTLAPELSGATDVVRHLVKRGVVVSMGHTDATWEEAAQGAAAGIRMGTHLFNAMPPLHHRRLGAVGFLLQSDLSVGIIADGVHMDLRMAELVSRMKSPDQLVLVTDALAGLGMPPGSFTLAGVEIVSDGTTGRRVDGTLSGSVLPLDSALGNLVRAGVAPEMAVRAASLNPARILGLDGQIGAVEVGRTADIAILDETWHTRATVIGGEVAFVALGER